jgi:hypothetical protein
LKISTSIYKNKQPKKLTLKSVDPMIYSPECSLDQFTQDSTDIKISKREKWFFHYETIYTENDKEYLNSKDFFEEKYFYFSLTKSDISDSDYDIC